MGQPNAGASGYPGGGGEVNQPPIFGAVVATANQDSETRHAFGRKVSASREVGRVVRPVLFVQRKATFKTFESLEIVIGRMDRTLMCQCECGNLRVGDEIAARGGCGLEQFQNTLDVSWIGVQHASYPSAEPARNVCGRLREAHRPKVCPGASADANERENNWMSQPDWLASRKTFLPPFAGWIVKRGRTVVGIKEQVDVRYNHADSFLVRLSLCVVSRNASTSDSSPKF